MKPADKEGLRQQMLLRALLGDARPGVVAGWLRESAGSTSSSGSSTGSRFERGLAAYRANAGAAAERALAAAFPTIQQLLGEDSFAALARAFWHRHPPLGGDLGAWGEGLAAFIADAESLAEEPYLPDMARLEWAVHSAERAADAAPLAGLELLQNADAAALQIGYTPGAAVVESVHPIVTIWAAHRSAAPDRFDAVRAAFAAGQGECALVLRSGFKAVVHALAPPEARYTQALLQGQSLAAALAQAGESFDFENWLITALREQRLASVRLHQENA
jgi:hypothetical protein